MEKEAGAETTLNRDGIRIGIRETGKGRGKGMEREKTTEEVTRQRFV